MIPQLHLSSAHQLELQLFSMNLTNPLSTRNRIHYAPPSRPRHDPEITYDLHTEPEEPQQEKPQRFSKDAIYHLISTTYSLLIIAFFKTLVDKVKKKIEPKAEPVETHVEPAKPEPKPTPTAPTIPLTFSSVRNPDPYASLFLVDSDEELEETGQYGTSLAISRNKFKARSEEDHANHILNSTSILPNRSLDSDIQADTASDFFSPSKPTDEYDAAVSKFYQPFKPLPSQKKTLTETILAGFPLVTSVLRDEQKKIQDLITTERKSLVSVVPPLAKDQLNIVQSYWGSRNSSGQVASAYSIDLTVRDLSTLADGQWLNDNVIDFYLNMVTDQNKLVYCWTTHFFSTLKQKGYQGVARWAKRRKINLFEKDKVIVPINIMSTHWALAVINNKKHTISYFDSLASRGNIAAVELLQTYMTKEAERLLLPPIDYNLIAGEKTPQQQNGFDCGVFTCTVAKFVSRDQPLGFGQQDMRNIRRRMAYEIILQTLLDNPLAPSAHL